MVRPRIFDDEVVTRALSLMLSTNSVRQAHEILKEEMDEPPAYKTLTQWGRTNTEVVEALHRSRKDQMVAVASDVAEAYAERMLEVVDELSPSQIPVAYGISMQRRTDWESTGNKGNQMNVQFNLVTHE